MYKSKQFYLQSFRINAFADSYAGELSYLQTLLKNCEKYLEPPKSHVLHVSKHGKNRFYYLRDEDGVHYLSKNDQTFKSHAMYLAAYRINKAAKKCLTLLTKNPEIYSREPLAKAYNSIYLDLGVDIAYSFGDPMTTCKVWQAEPYRHNSYAYNEQSSFVTLRGETVRSKNEVLVADILNSLSIPYRYELMLRLKDGSFLSPDFTVLSPTSGRIHYIELFGMMSSSDYVSSTLNKLKTYSKEGLVLGRDLIPIFDSVDSPIDINIVKTQIETIVLCKEQ